MVNDTGRFKMLAGELRACTNGLIDAMEGAIEDVTSVRRTDGNSDPRGNLSKMARRIGDLMSIYDSMMKAIGEEPSFATERAVRELASNASYEEAAMLAWDQLEKALRQYTPNMVTIELMGGPLDGTLHEAANGFALTEIIELSDERGRHRYEVRENGKAFYLRPDPL